MNNPTMLLFAGWWQAGAARILSYKFLPLLYQLAARLGACRDEAQAFGRTLRRLLAHTAAEHPHHAVPVILALANANKDDELATGGLRGPVRRQPPGRLGAGPGPEQPEDEVRPGEHPPC